MSIRKPRTSAGSESPQDAEPLTGAQPAGSGATPGSAEAAEETFGEALKRSVAGEQVAPGVNDGTEPKVDPELAETEDDTLLAQDAEEPMVKYNGPFSRREISVRDWQLANVADMPMVVWDRRNGMKVPASAFTEQALQVLRQDGGFEVP